MIIKCKICGGDLEIIENSEIAVCEYCGSKQTLPKLSDEKRLNLYERANHFRRNNEYDKAMGIYEMILNEDASDAEAYWSLVLCKYGVEYVEDPATRKRIPTCNRTLNVSVMADEDYKAALRNAGGLARVVYEEEAKKIDEIQKEILAISAKEEAYDIFICYKESDDRGRRTRDSVLAQDIYQQLTKEGYRVFFARVTLEDKIGSAYEPYIYSALSSAKVMILVGTEKEYFNAVWVKNEWSRFLSMMKENPEKVMIPAYRDMDPYDLPDELLYLQAQDMGKLGFMQDLLHGIQKILHKNVQATSVLQVAEHSQSTNIDNLLLRIEAFLQDGDVNKAQEYCDKVLDIKIDEAQVYIAQLRIETYRRYGGKIRTEEELATIPENLGLNSFFVSGLKYATGKYQEKLNLIKKRNALYCYEKIIKPAIKAEKILTNGQVNLIKQFATETGEEKWKLFLDYGEALKEKERIAGEINKINSERNTLQKQYDEAVQEYNAAESSINLYGDKIAARKWTKLICWGAVVAWFLIFAFIMSSGGSSEDGSGYIVVFWVLFITAIVITKKLKISELESAAGKYLKDRDNWSTKERTYEKQLTAKKTSLNSLQNSKQVTDAKITELQKEVKEVFENDKLEVSTEDLNVIDGTGATNGNETTSKKYALGEVAFVCDVCGAVSQSKQKPFKCMVCNAPATKMMKKQYNATGWE